MPTRLDADLLETFSFAHSHATLWSTGKLHIFSGPLLQELEQTPPALRMTNTLPLHEAGTLQKLLTAADALFAVVASTVAPLHDFTRKQHLVAEFQEATQGESLRFILASKLSLPSQAALIFGFLLNARGLKPALLELIIEQLVPFENHYKPTLAMVQLYPYPHMNYSEKSTSVAFIRNEDDYRASVLIYTFLAAAPETTSWAAWKQEHWADPFALFNQLSVEEVFPELRPLWPHLLSFPASLTPKKLKLLAAVLAPTALNSGTFRALVEYLPEDLLQKLKTRGESRGVTFTGQESFSQTFLHYLLPEQTTSAYRVLNKYKETPAGDRRPAHAELYAMIYHMGGAQRFEEFVAMVHREELILPERSSLEFLGKMKIACGEEWEGYPLDFVLMVT